MSLHDPRNPRRRILVVDDEVMVGRAVVRLLPHDQYEGCVATSGVEALRRVGAGESFDVILCDLFMPEITGIDLYEELKRLRPDLAPSVIFLTGGAFSPTAEAFLDGIPNARLDKPFDRDALLSLLRATAGDGNAPVGRRRLTS